MRAQIEVRNFTGQKGYKEVISRAVRAVLRLLSVQGEIEVSVALVGSARMKSLNTKWRKKARATDVLSFGLWESEKEGRRGEIVICIPYAKKQARAMAISMRENCATLAAHGMIHLAGIDHERSKKEYQTTIEIQKKAAQQADQRNNASTNQRSNKSVKQCVNESTKQRINEAIKQELIL